MLQHDRRGHVDDRRPPPACIARLDRRSTAASAYHSPQSTAPVSAVSTPSLGSDAHGTAPQRGSEQRPRTKPIKARRRTALNKPLPRYSQAVLRRQACKPAAPGSATPAAHVPLQGQKAPQTRFCAACCCKGQNRVRKTIFCCFLLTSFLAGY